MNQRIAQGTEEARRHIAQQIEDVAPLYQQGMSVVDIARQEGVSVVYVAALLLRGGLISDDEYRVHFWSDSEGGKRGRESSGEHEAHG